MKKPGECIDIKDIREAINEIDRQIIESLGRRYEYVKAASKFKKNESEVRAEDRVRSMLKQRRVWAAEEGLGPDFIEELYKSIVSYFIDQELRIVKLPEVEIESVQMDELAEILALQHMAYYSEAKICNDFMIQPLTQDITDIKKEFDNMVFLKAVLNGAIVGSVRCRIEGDTCFVGKLIVHPEYQNKGIGFKLLVEIEKRFDKAERFELFTGSKSDKNIYLYKKNGYRIYKNEKINETLTLVYMEKKRSDQTRLMRGEV